MKKLLLLTVAPLLVLVAPAVEADDAVYSAPYAAGPTGGDNKNYMSVDEDGRITVARADPVPGALGCSAKAGYAKYLVTHQVDTPVDAVTVAFAEAVVDPYTFIVATVRDQAGRSLGYASVRGRVGEGELVIPLETLPDEAPTSLAVEFGLELSSACPSVDAGTARFTSVTIREKAA